MATYGTPMPTNTAYSSISASLSPSFGMAGQGATMGGAQVAAGPAYTGPGSSFTLFGQPFTIFLGLILLLVIFRVAEEFEGKIPLDPADLHIGPYNIMAIGVTSVTFIVLFKTLANRFQVAGLTQFANFI